MRTTCGGVFVAVGVLLFVISSKHRNIENGLLCIIFLMVCMTGGRIYGVAIDGSANTLMHIHLAIEIGMAGISWWAFAHYVEKNSLLLNCLFDNTY